MSATQVIALSPLLSFGALCVLAMLVVAFCRQHRVVAGLSAASCLAGLATVTLARAVAPQQVTALLLIDEYALLFMSLLLGATLVVVFLSSGYRPLRDEQDEEYYLLLLLATLGGLVMVAAAHFATFFLGLEIIGVSLYGLIGYLRRRSGPLEAALKYLILSGAASAFLLFGMALMYFDGGALAFSVVTERTPSGDGPSLWMAGFLMMLVGIGFKLGLVPFHPWMPDVYQGAPAPITAYIATVSKAAVFAALFRFASQGHVLASGARPALAVLAIASMTIGNFLALQQDNVKRLIAYSSIAHFGYLLVALVAAGPLAGEAVGFYLVAYVITTLGVLASVCAGSGRDHDAEHIDDYRALFWTRPWLAAALALMLLSLAGIPLTAGFVGKFYAIMAGLAGGMWWLVLALIFNSAVGVYYYLRWLLVLFDRPISVGSNAIAPPGENWGAVLSLALLTSLLLWLGVYPSPVIAWIHSVMAPIMAPLPAPVAGIAL
jgi:NADH-quinone oxidoreductase subunit N